MSKRVIYEEDAIDAIQKLNIPEDMCVFEILSHIGVAIATLPSAQPEPQKAIWALHTYMPHNYYCTHCKNDSPYNKTWSYCPNCGYEMEDYV